MFIKLMPPRVYLGSQEKNRCLYFVFPDQKLVVLVFSEFRNSYFHIGSVYVLYYSHCI